MPITPSHPRNLVLQLVGDEVCDSVKPPFASIDQVIGSIMFDLIQLASAPANSEQALEHLVRIASQAALGAADLGLGSTEEDR